MDTKDTALLLIGYQNDYFAKDGILHKNIENPNTILKNTIALLNKLVLTDILIISTPIAFEKDYRELHDPVGILEVIRKLGAFQKGTKGVRTVSEVESFGNRIVECPGKIGLNAFESTHLDDELKRNNIKNLVLAGAVTSVCIDSTGRSATEHGYHVTQLSDCSSARTQVEQDFYCYHIFPIYARVMNSTQLLQELGVK